MIRGLCLILSGLIAVFASPLHAAEPTGPNLFDEASARRSEIPVNLSRVLFDLSPGQKWGEMRTGLLCVPRGDMKWKTGRLDVQDDTFISAFRQQMRSAGYQSGSNNLFEGTESADGAYSVGARVKDIQARICYWHIEPEDPILEFGSAIMTVEWQIYSRLERRLVATVSTSGSFEIKKKRPDNLEPILMGAFSRSAAAFSDTDEFRRIFDAAAPNQPSATQASGALAPIALLGTPNAARPISEASGAVVLIFAGNSMGSAFLVSSDGYMITNAHVVGSEKTVRVRWSDGFESDGEVIRSHKARDVALIKTNPHGRQPLALRRGPPTPGMNVYAVGTPLDPKLQGSLTKGIVSANRIMDGFSFIQSDVAVTHGNSGGPLLDEQSTVIGITDLGFEPDGKPANINLFIPIGDALDFLNLKISP
jgi:serine protease Do